MKVPVAELTRPLGSGTVRYHCPVTRCRWHWDERPGLEPSGPIPLPINFTPENLDQALTAMACKLATAQARRVETVLRAHLTLAHPGYLKDQHQ
ncbi:hypothetical protein [Actinomadura sp. WMMA1423]|uniref:hypothetical protein n=1 Tax=Actinomadura sp. WMMA1423 TaxID=2591108 RepID=UPI0011474DF5|nr:hypothetical protein [Actinomadura sp. WMMA1423]